jgi:hypothetical protein
MPATTRWHGLAAKSVSQFSRFRNGQGHWWLRD